MGVVVKKAELNWLDRTYVWPVMKGMGITFQHFIKQLFTPIAAALTLTEKNIVSELIAVQGKPTDIGGYYQPDEAKASAALRPSATFNRILATI